MGSNPVQSLNFFQVIFPVVSWLHSHFYDFIIIKLVLLNIYYHRNLVISFFNCWRYTFYSKLALLKVDCQLSPLGRRLPSQVTTSVCENSQTPSSRSDELTSSAVSSIESTLEKNETQNVTKHEIICRNAANGTPRTWKDWLKDPAFYKVFCL